MVVLSASVLTKSGKILVSRQFCDMTRISLEGFLSALPKLIGTGEKQFTFIETEAVRYVYQPLEDLYLVLLTSRNSNIVDDLETLRLLSRVVPDTCRELDAESISENAFSLLFAFDEVVAMGYRENATLEQVKTYLEMDSNAERLANVIKDLKLERAREQAADAEREIAASRAKGRTGAGISSSNYESYEDDEDERRPMSTSPVEPVAAPAPAPVATAGLGKPSGGMKLGGGPTDIVSKMIKTGEVRASKTVAAVAAAPPPPEIAASAKESVHVKISESMSVALGRGGEVSSIAVSGELFLTIGSGGQSAGRIRLSGGESDAFNWQPNPKLSKPAWTDARTLCLAGSPAPFPSGGPRGLLRWRYVPAKGTLTPPLSVTVWPSDESLSLVLEIDDGCGLECLESISLTVPLGAARAKDIQRPSVGAASFDPASGSVVWILPRLDASSGSITCDVTLDREVPEDSFFPTVITFYSKQLLSNLKVIDVTSLEDGSSMKYSSEALLSAEKYEME